MEYLNITEIELNSTIPVGSSPIRFIDIITEYCTAYDGMFSTAVVMIFFMYIFNTFAIKKALYTWQHPKGVLYEHLPTDVRMNIAKFIEWMQYGTDGMGFMASMVLVYVLWMQEAFGFWHHFLLYLGSFIFVINVVGGLAQVIRERKKRGDNNV